MEGKNDMDQDILQMQSIEKSFPGVKALSGVTLSARRGEVHAICGENGAGKSTLMKVLSGVYPHGTYGGKIFFEGQECKFDSIRDSERAGIVIIHQELALVPHLSIAENIFLGNEQLGANKLIDWHKTFARAAELLERVGLKEEPTTLVGQLGVGKQQLVEIAKSLSKDVKLLILDEPTAALNDNDSAHLLGLVRQLQAQGITSIIISHKLNEIEALANSTTVIRDGQTVETMDMASDDATVERIIRSMVGRDLEAFYPERDPKPGEVVLEVKDWTVKHPLQDRLVVDGASLHVRAGEVVGIAGLMGAGRTELAMSLFGRSYGRYISGSAFMHGKKIAPHSVAQAIDDGLAYVSEDRKHYGLNLLDTISRNISGAALPKLAKFGWIDSNKEDRLAQLAMEKMRIKAPSIRSIVGQLSGGNQQKVVLSKWLLTGPEVLIIDEPTRGIDVGAKYEIYELINEFVEAGKAVVVISSDLLEILGTCDRIYTLSQGRITGEVPVASATEESLMTLMTKEKELVR